MDVAGFIVAYPEFAPTAANDVGTAYIQRRLDQASKLVSVARFQDRWEEVVYLKAAHLMAMSPYGEGARLSKTSKETVYGELWKQELMALPVRVITADEDWEEP